MHLESDILQLALTSSRAARFGISGLILVVLFLIFSQLAIVLLARGDTEPTDAGAWGFSLLTLIGTMIGMSFGIPSLFVVGGSLAFVAAGPLLEFRWIPRILIGILTPAVFFLALLVGTIAQDWIIDRVLNQS